jgi:hypothetical protein
MRMKDSGLILKKGKGSWNIHIELDQEARIRILARIKGDVDIDLL